MTQELSADGVDSDRLDVSQRRWRGVVASAAVGVIVGAVIGGVYGSTRPTSYTASTTLNVQPDTSLASTVQANSATTTLDPTAYIQSQLVVLNGDPLREAVRKQLSLGTKPGVTSTEIGQTYVVQVTATGPSSSVAKKVATAIGAGYATQRASQFTARVNAALTSTKTQLTSVQKSLVAAQVGSVKGSAVTPSETALQTEFARLLTVKSSLSLALPEADQLVTVLTPVGESAAKVSATKKDAVGGAALCAVAAIAILVLVRRTSRRVRAISDVAALGVPVLLPVMQRKPAHGRRTPQAWRSHEGRLLSARLTTSHGGGTPIVVVGATSGVGATFVAASLATSLSTRGPVLLITAPAKGADFQTAPRSFADDILASSVPGLWILAVPFSYQGPFGTTSVESVLHEVMAYAELRNWRVVIDAPALDESDVAVDITGSGATAALVVGRDVSRSADVLSASELFTARGARLEGVILNEVPRWLNKSATDLAPKSGTSDHAQPRRPDPESPTDGGRATTRVAGSSGGSIARDEQRRPVRPVPHRSTSPRSMTRTMLGRKP